VSDKATEEVPGTLIDSRRYRAGRPWDGNVLRPSRTAAWL